MKNFSAKLSETVLLALRAETKIHFVCFERLFTLSGHQMVSEKYFLWNMKQNSSLLVFKTQQPETVWLWISMYKKIVKHGRSIYLKVEPLSSSSCLRSKIVFKDN